MSIRMIAAAAFVVLVFTLGFLGLILSKGTKVRAPTSRSVKVLASFDGKLNVRAIDDLRVGGRKVVLCGVSPPRLASMRDVASQVARKDLQGVAVSCKPVGAGTPCDGNTGAKLGDAVVVQCFTSDGTDLAAMLVERGLACGVPAHAGTVYKAC